MWPANPSRRDGITTLHSRILCHEDLFSPPSSSGRSVNVATGKQELRLEQDNIELEFCVLPCLEEVETELSSAFLMPVGYRIIELRGSCCPNGKRKRN